MRKNPMIIGSEVPTARRSRKEEVFPAKSEREMEEKRNAESPKPEITSPVVIPLCRPR
jgi:hypothetical protein